MPLTTDGHLVVLHGQQLHLGGALLRQDIAEEVERPAGSNRYGVGLGGDRRVGVQRRICTHGRGAADGDSRQEGQLSGGEHGFVHLDVEGCVEQVGIVGQTLVDERLQLGVGEDAAPGQVAEGGSVLDGQRVTVGQGVAYESLSLDILRALVLII